MRQLVMVLIVLTAILTGCRPAVDGTPVATQQPAGGNTTASTPVPSYAVNVTTDPATPAVGEAVVVLVLTAPDGAPVPAAQVQSLRVQGDMTHAGMIPVVEEYRAAAVATDQAGRYAIPFNFDMAGDWILSVTATLTNGTVIYGRLTLSVQ